MRSLFQNPWRTAGLTLLGSSALAATLWWGWPTTPDAALSQAQPKTSKFVDPHAPPKDHRDPEVDGEPGFYQQWFDMRKDENGIIPRGLRQQWYAHDRRQLALHSAARSANPFQSTTFLGPTNVGGRTRALHVDYANPLRILAGGISGGLWRTEDGGTTWAPLNDAAATLAVSSITQSPFNDSLWYYGTGESRGNSAGLAGDGIWKSTDGGNTFSQLASTTSSSNFDQTWKIEHGKDPNAPNTVYLATNAGGLYRTTDAGTTWVRVMPTPSQVNDIITFADGGVMVSAHGSGLYYSPNGNTGTYTKLVHANLPASGFKRVEIENCAGTPDAIYALFENSAGNGVSDLIYSSDRGQTWQTRSVPSVGNTFSRYCIMLGVHATDINKLVAGASNSYYEYSTNGGNTWSIGDISHADHHTVAYDPNDPNVFYVGNDGGVFRHTWINPTLVTDLNIGYHTTQFYAGFYAQAGDQAFGGTQDNGTHSVGNLLGAHQYKIAGGDGGPSFINQQSLTSSGYQSYQRGWVYRWRNMNSNFLINYERQIHLDTMLNEGVNFIHPYTINRTNGSQLYYPTAKGLWVSVDAGNNWTKVVGSNSNLGTFYAVEAAPSADPPVYYGGSSGRLYRVDNAATAPANGSQTRMTLPTSISSRTISGIHATSDSTIYVCFSTQSSFPHVWKVTGANTASPTWTDIAGNLPASLPVNRLAVNPNDEQQIFAGTDFGLYYTEDGGTTWLKHTALPNVAVFDVHLRPNDQKLFIFTHGRGIWLSEISNVIATQQIAASEQIFAPSLFPNPVQERVYVRNQFETIEGAHLSVYDLQGRLVANQSGVTLVEGVSGAASLEVGHLPPSSYVLVIEAPSGERQTLKFLKQ